MLTTKTLVPIHHHTVLHAHQSYGPLISFLCVVLVWLWYQDNVGLVKWVRKYSLLFNFLEDFVYYLFCKCFIEFTSEIILWLFWGFLVVIKKNNNNSAENVDNRQSRLLMLASASSPAADSILIVYHPCQLPGRLKLASERCSSNTLWGWSQ